MRVKMKRHSRTRRKKETLMELSAAITARDWICFIQHKAPDALCQPGRLFWIITDRAGDRRLQTPLLWGQWPLWGFTWDSGDGLGRFGVFEWPELSQTSGAAGRMKGGML